MGSHAAATRRSDDAVLDDRRRFCRALDQNRRHSRLAIHLDNDLARSRRDDHGFSQIGPITPDLRQPQFHIPKPQEQPHSGRVPAACERSFTRD